MSANRGEYPAIDRDAARWFGKLLIASLSLLFLSSLVSLLPGIDRMIPGSPVTIVALAGAIVTIAVVGLLLLLAPAFATLVRTTLRGPEPIVDDVAAILQLAIVFVAMIIAHRGLAPAIVPVLDELAWLYDLVFLAVALPPLAILVARVYVSLGPMAEVLADRLTSSADGDEPPTDSR